MVPATFLPWYLTADRTDAELAYVLKAAISGRYMGEGAEGDDIVSGELFARQHLGGGADTDDGHVKYPNHVWCRGS